MTTTFRNHGTQPNRAEHQCRTNRNTGTGWGAQTSQIEQSLLKCFSPFGTSIPLVMSRQCSPHWPAFLFENKKSIIAQVVAANKMQGVRYICLAKVAEAR